jgi:AcrR family transcriptional regulator
MLTKNRLAGFQIQSFNLGIMKKDSVGLKKNENTQLVRIGKVAAKLFNEKGYLETSLKEISAAARLSKGGIYHYFSSKNEILYFILSNYMDITLEGLEQKLSEIEGAFPKIKFIVSRHIDLYVRYLAESKILLHEAHCLPKKHYKIIAGKEKKYYQIVARVLSDFFENRIPKHELTALTFSLFGMCNWIYSWYNPKGPITPQKLSEIIYVSFYKGISSYQI